MSKDIQKLASRISLAMAYDREKFKDKLEEYIGGALSEYYKARLGKKNNQTKWIQHWETETRNLLRSAAAAMRHSIRGFKDKRKAYNEVSGYLQSRDSGYRVSAQNEVIRDYKFKKLKVSIDDHDTNSFWEMVSKVIEPELVAFKS